MRFGKKVIGTVAYMGGIMAVPSPFVWSWTQMIQYNNQYLVNPEEEIMYDRVTVSYHSFARNYLVKQMRGDWLLMLDTDHQFEPDIVARMLKVMADNPEVEVLSGIYQYVIPPYHPKMFRFNEDLNLEAIGDWDKKKGRYLVPVGSVGAGCLLVKRNVYNRVRNELKEEPFDIIPPYSEDNSFFRRLKKLGIKAYVDPSIEYPHLQMRPVTMKDYDRTKLKLRKAE